MSATPKFKSVWDALIDNPEDLKKKSDYLILIQARLYGMSGKLEDKAALLEISADQVRDLIEGKADKYSLPELIAIARKIGVTVRV